MPRLPPGLPDWKDAAAYAPLLEAERAGFAWEWLRRNACYREEAGRRSKSNGVSGQFRIVEEEHRALAWGLHAFEDPRLSTMEARPMWDARKHGLVLSATAEPAGQGPNAFALERLSRFATLVEGADGTEHLLLSDGLRAIRVDVLTGTLRAGPVQLRYRLEGMESAQAPLLVLRRLLGLWHKDRFQRALHPRQARARRFILMLRVYDALARGATQREIAGELLSSDAECVLWRTQAPSLRSTVQRLVHSARSMANGQYRDLLDPPPDSGSRFSGSDGPS